MFNKRSGALTVSHTHIYHLLSAANAAFRNTSHCQEQGHPSSAFLKLSNLLCILFSPYFCTGVSSCLALWHFCNPLGNAVPFHRFLPTALKTCARKFHSTVHPRKGKNFHVIVGEQWLNTRKYGTQMTAILHAPFIFCAMSGSQYQ